VSAREKAVDLVRRGRTYLEAAEACGLTRNQVAGMCHRAGVKAPMTDEKTERANDRQSIAKLGRKRCHAVVSRKDGRARTCLRWLNGGEFCADHAAMFVTLQDRPPTKARGR
jgi:hypothetical protein